jgi:curved DNA-binding protein CbpA
LKYEFFHGVANAQDLKTRYRQLAFSLHPDKGGDVKRFQAMAAEYHKINNDAFISYPLGGKAKARATTETAWGEMDLDDLFEYMNKVHSTSKAKQSADFRNYKANPTGGARGQQYNPFNEAAYKAAEDLAARQRAKAEQMRREAEAKKDPERSRWESLRGFDENYDVIDGVLRETIACSRSGNYMLMELCKLDDLDLNHFQYIRYWMKRNGKEAKFELPVGWEQTSYKAYVHIRQIKWTS